MQLSTSCRAWRARSASYSTAKAWTCPRPRAWAASAIATPSPAQGSMMHSGPFEDSAGASAASALSSVGSSVGKYPFLTKLRASRGNMSAMRISWAYRWKEADMQERTSGAETSGHRFDRQVGGERVPGGGRGQHVAADQAAQRQIGRASCRERV